VYGCAHHYALVIRGAQPLAIKIKGNPMRKEFRQEWNRLNPKFVTPHDSLVQAFGHAAKETVHGFFSPLFFTLWALKFIAGSILKRM
jgi:hypothetical protein